MARLFYVMGASGAGKDSILGYARKRIAPADNCVFAHRYITRPSDAGGENHVALTEREFEYRSQSGFFCMEWASHSLHYGVGSEVRLWMEKGTDVILNGSRAYLEQAKLLFPTIVPVLIRVSPQILRERLIARNRETMDEIEKRIQRATEVSCDDEGISVIHNDSELSGAGNLFLGLIRSGRNEPEGLKIKTGV